MLLRDLSSKIENLFGNLSLSSEDINKRINVCNRIHSSLRSFYPECKLVIYGSTLNGYGTKESDLDLLFIPTPEYRAETHCTKVGDKKETPTSPTIYNITSGKVPIDELLLMDREMQLHFVRRVLKRDKMFKKSIQYIPARCPILHFQIPYLNISCDISCSSRHVVCNTQLLRFYNVLDSRLQPLVVILRHWGKSVGLILSGILSSYAMTLLAVFFLQTVEPPVLPSVKHLQELSELTKLEDGWNVAFTLDSQKVEKSRNTKSVGELFREFFHFYEEFDFSNNIVCPNSGKSLPIKKLLNSTDIRMKEFEISPMCIQDPFLFSCNTSRNMKTHIFQFFKQAVFLAGKIIDGQELDDNFSILFSKAEYIRLCKESLNPPMSEKSISFPIDFKLSNLLTDSVLESRIFYQIACNALLELLQYGLLIDCEVVNRSEVNLDNIKTDKDVSFHFLMCIQCAIYNRTYVGRSKIKDKELPIVDCDAKQFDNSIISSEYIVSNYLIQQNPLLTSPEPFFWFYCDVYLSFLGKFENFVVILTPLTETKEKKSAFVFFRSFIEKFLPRVLSNITNLSSKMETL